MFNLIRMDLVRMRKMTCFIVLPVLFIMILGLEAYTTKRFYERVSNVSELAEGMDIEIDDESADTMQSLLDKMELKVDMLEQYGSLVPANMFALFLAIFTVLFCCADYSSGFIKTIGGQVSLKSKLVFSKLITMAIFEVFFFAVTFAANTVFGLIFFNSIEFNDVGHFMGFMGVQMLMHFCLMCFCAMVTMVARNALVGMIFSMMTVLGFFELLMYLIDRLIKAVLDKTVTLSDYLVMTRITSTGYDESKEIAFSLIVCGVTAVISIMLSCLSAEKRDVI